MIKLVYAPFCTPAVPPLSLANLKALIPNATCLDLNVKFHRLKFSKLDLTEIRKCYAENNRKVLNGKKPEYFDELLKILLEDNPDTIIFSFVYNSQCFYGLKLIEELKKRKIKVIVGGPGVSHKIYENADKFCKDYVELMEYLKKDYEEPYPDYSDFNYKDYFVDDITLSFKTCNSCHYRQCAFCTHHHNMDYKDFDLIKLKESIKKSNAKNIFFVDDMIAVNRLKQIGNMMKELEINWICQLRPKGLDYSLLKELNDSGLKAIMWGVESGSQLILDKIKKGTKIEEIKQVITDSHKAGIKNITFIMFGFPGETKEQAQKTLNFLEEIKESIDLIQTSTFGLHYGSKVYNNPKDYGIKIIKEKRTILDDKISYETSSGMTWQEADTFRKKHKKYLKSFSKLPEELKFFKVYIFNQKLFKTTKN